jgi:hypothetical protein
MQESGESSPSIHTSYPWNARIPRFGSIWFLDSIPPCSRRCLCFLLRPGFSRCSFYLTCCGNLHPQGCIPFLHSIVTLLLRIRIRIHASNMLLRRCCVAGSQAQSRVYVCLLRIRTEHSVQWRGLTPERGRNFRLGIFAVRSIVIFVLAKRLGAAKSLSRLQSNYNCHASACQRGTICPPVHSHPSQIIGFACGVFWRQGHTRGISVVESRNCMRCATSRQNDPRDWVRF